MNSNYMYLPVERQLAALVGVVQASRFIAGGSRAPTRRLVKLPCMHVGTYFLVPNGFKCLYNLLLLGSCVLSFL